VSTYPAWEFVIFYKSLIPIDLMILLYIGEAICYMLYWRDSTREYPQDPGNLLYLVPSIL